MLQCMSEISPFLRLNNIPFCVYNVLLIHMSVAGDLSCFHVMAIVDTAVMNIGAQISQVSFCNFFDYRLRNRIARSCIHPIFNFWVTTILFFHNSYTIFISPLSANKGSISLNTHQHFLFSVFMIITTLIGLKWYLIEDLTYISSIVSNVKQLFMCLLVICLSYLEKCLSALSIFNLSYF